MIQVKNTLFQELPYSSRKASSRSTAAPMAAASQQALAASPQLKNHLSCATARTGQATATALSVGQSHLCLLPSRHAALLSAITFEDFYLSFASRF